MTSPTVVEIWRPLAAYPGYAISNVGRVKSLPRTVSRANRWGTISPHRVRERILKPGRQKSGHLFVVMHIGDIEIQQRVHRLVMLEFGTPEPWAGAVVRHWDDDTENNQIGNLRWGTQTENMADAKRNGRVLGGYRPKGSKQVGGVFVRI